MCRYEYLSSLEGDWALHVAIKKRSGGDAPHGGGDSAKTSKKKEIRPCKVCGKQISGQTKHPTTACAAHAKKHQQGFNNVSILDGTLQNTTAQAKRSAQQTKRNVRQRTEQIGPPEQINPRLLRQNIPDYDALVDVDLLSAVEASEFVSESIEIPLHEI